MASILCKNGSEHTHASVEESRQCWARVLTVPDGMSPVPPISVQPFVGRVDPSAVPGVTRPTPEPPASVTPPVPAEPYAMQHRTRVPLPMLVDTPSGYFAVRLDDTDAYHFIRISRPQPRKGVRIKWLGCIQVQSQHSDTLKPVLIYRPLGALEDKPEEVLWISNPKLEKYVILCMVDPRGAGYAYARELGDCQICGRTLTDERSRHYGIGPDCEQLHPDVIEYVDGLEAEEED
jgi:hypothetical protein